METADGPDVQLEAPDMKQISMALPTLLFIAGTRAALGAGVGLLLADRLPARRRHAVGAALIAVGAVTTIPAIVSVKRSLGRARRMPPGVGYDPGLVGATRYPRKGDDDMIS